MKRFAGFMALLGSVGFVLAAGSVLFAWGRPGDGAALHSGLISAAAAALLVIIATIAWSRPDQ